MPLVEADRWDVNCEDVDGGKGTLRKGLKLTLVNELVLQYCMASAYNNCIFHGITVISCDHIKNERYQRSLSEGTVLGVIEIKTSDHKKNGEEILSYDKKKNLRQ